MGAGTSLLYFWEDGKLIGVQSGVQSATDAPRTDLENELVRLFDERDELITETDAKARKIINLITRAIEAEKKLAEVEAERDRLGLSLKQSRASVCNRYDCAGRVPDTPASGQTQD